MTLKRATRRLLFHIAYNLYAKRKLTKTDLISVSGFSFEVPPTVFHPSLYFSSKLLGKYLLTQQVERKEILDLGCGSGILSIIAASRGALVTAVDINAAAVEATILNARRNSLETLITTKQSNLFDGLDSNSRFDIILLNPPFYTGDPQSIADYAWQGGSDHHFIRQFTQEAKQHVKKGGSIVFILSSEMDVDLIRDVFEKAHYELSIISTKKILFETFSICKAIYHP